MTYKCICGEEFDNPQKFNHHKSECKIHIESKGFDYNLYVDNIRQKQSIAAKANAEKRKIELQLKKQKELDSWISAQHTCEKCGKVMTEKYGSGRFCSKSCANTRMHSDETKIKIKESVKLLPHSFGNELGRNACRISSERTHCESVKQYNLNPHICMHCGKTIPYELRRRKTCSNECFSKVVGGFREGSVKGYKYGTYHNIKCDSSYELAFVVYCLEHNINIIRNREQFLYEVDNKIHSYSPDFKINNTYIEIKNYETDVVIAKANAVKTMQLSYMLLYGKDIQPCIDYCIEKYGKQYWEILYDKDKPSCNDKTNNNGIS